MYIRAFLLALNCRDCLNCARPIVGAYLSCAYLWLVTFVCALLLRGPIIDFESVLKMFSLPILRFVLGCLRTLRGRRPPFIELLTMLQSNGKNLLIKFLYFQV